jgi:hypothetical protein
MARSTVTSSGGNRPRVCALLWSHASNSHSRDLWHRYEQTLKLVKEQFVDDVHGGWKLTVKRTCDSGHCGNEQPDPYHTVGMDVIALGLYSTGSQAR